jgi:CheY-like chemotaxis protein
MKKVLVVDDDISVRASMQKVLQGAGYEVLLAADGREAVNRFETGHIDLLLLDMNLPVRSGLDILGHVRAKDPYLPIIILTAYADQYRSAAAAGVSAFMEKPLDASRLLEAIQELLGDHQEERRQRLAASGGKPSHMQDSNPQPSSVVMARQN